MYAPFCHACVFSLGPSCSAVCRRGNLQRPVPHRLWVAQWPLQDCHLWIQVRKHCWIFQCLYRRIVSLQKASIDFFLFCLFLLASTRSSRSILMNLMMSDENNRDIYVTIASMPPPKPCSHCCPFPSSTTIRTGESTHGVTPPPLRLSNQTSSFFFSGQGECLEHGYVLNSRYQVVYPFPTFQPAFQLKKDQVILLNTSYSLVACGISLCPGNIHIQHW